MRRSVAAVRPRHWLEMLQAHAGDLLRIVTRTESVIVDAGPPSCRDTLADLLGGQQRCRLLVLTTWTRTTTAVSGH